MSSSLDPKKAETPPEVPPKVPRADITAPGAEPTKESDPAAPPGAPPGAPPVAPTEGGASAPPDVQSSTDQLAPLPMQGGEVPMEKVPWLYRGFNQVIMVGLVALCCPGLFNAMSGLGKAGGKNADDANMANASLYAFFAVFGYFGGFLFNLFGPRFLMGVGGLFYALYALGMWLAGNYEKAGPVAILVGALLGIGAGMFWTAQGALTVGYATPMTRGKYISVFWILFNIGGVFGGLLQFGLNYNTSVDSASDASYFTFMGLMLLGAFASWIVLVSPEKVVKEDGTKVSWQKNPSATEEIMGALKASTHKVMLLLLVLFLASNWYYTYQFNFVNGALFTIRTRGLNSAIYWAAQMLAAYVFGFIVDMEGKGKRARAYMGLAFVYLSFVVAWCCGAWLEYAFEGGYDKDRPISPTDLIDFTQSKRAAFPIFIFAWYGWADAALQAYAYWVMGAVAGSNTSLMAHYAGFYKGIQSIGACIAWGMDLSPSVTYEYQFWIGFGLWAIGTILCYVAARFVSNIEETPEKAAEKMEMKASAVLGIGEVAVHRSGSVLAEKLEKRRSASAELQKLVTGNLQTAADTKEPLPLEKAS